jgi:hypothetical protein
MFRELSSPIHLGSYFAGVGTAVLVVIIGWLLLQMLSTATPITLPSGDGEISISTAMSTEISPVDRKLLDEGYLAMVMDRGELDLPANVHPADRKFFSDTYANYAAPAAGADPFSLVNPADRKFFTNNFVTEQ